MGGEEQGDGAEAALLGAALARLAGDVVLVLAEDGRCEEVLHGAERSWVGGSLAALFDAETAELLRGAMEEVARTKEVAERCCCAPKSGRSSVLRVTPLEGTGRVLLGLRYVAAHAATEPAPARDAVLASVTHELRTPMNAIIGLTYLCLRSELSEQQRDYVLKVNRAARALVTLLDDLLDYAKLREGKVELEVAPLRVASVVAAVDSLAGCLARQKGIAFETHVSEAIPKNLLGDAFRLQQVLLNLVGNAVKFTPSGAVCLEARVQSWDADSVTVAFTVHDTGIGMSEAQQSKLFEPFSQAEAGTTRRFGGTGLGLAISKRLVALMGGCFTVRSAPAIGSSFGFCVRLRRGAHASVPPPEEHGEVLAAAQERLAGARVLVAEDNPFNQQLLRELLEDVGALVTEALNGREALELLSSRVFDLVLMDVQMPELDGWEVTRRMRRLSAGASVPVIAVTASALAEDLLRCREAGMDDHLVKPLDPEMLFLTMSRWLGKPSPHARSEES